MSRVTIYEVRPDGEVKQFGEASNATAWAPCIWDHLGRLYGYLKPGELSIINRTALDTMWDEWPHPRMSASHRLLLGSTFDAVWVKRELIPPLIEAAEDFYANVVSTRGKDGHRIDSRAAIGIIHHLQMLEGRCRGVAFNMTSVSPSFWTISDVEGDDDWRPYNIDRDKMHTWGEYKDKSAWELSERMGDRR